MASLQLAGYVAVTLMTFDKPSNGRRTVVVTPHNVLTFLCRYLLSDFVVRIILIEGSHAIYEIKYFYIFLTFSDILAFPDSAPYGLYVLLSRKKSTRIMSLETMM